MLFLNLFSKTKNSQPQTIRRGKSRKIYSVYWFPYLCLFTSGRSQGMMIPLDNSQHSPPMTGKQHILFPHVVLLDLSDALPAWDLDPLLVLETVPVHADRGDSGCSDEFAAVESSTIACWLVILCYYSGLGFLVGESIINSEKKYRCPESNMEVSHLEAQLKLQMGMLSPWMYTPTSWGKNPFNFPWLWFYRDLDLELHFQPMSSLDS